MDKPRLAPTTPLDFPFTWKWNSRSELPFSSFREILKARATFPSSKTIARPTETMKASKYWLLFPLVDSGGEFPVQLQRQLQVGVLSTFGSSKLALKNHPTANPAIENAKPVASIPYSTALQLESKGKTAKCHFTCLLNQLPASRYYISSGTGLNCHQ